METENLRKPEPQEEEFAPERTEMPPLFSWERFCQQGIVCLLVLLAFFRLERSPARSPAGLAMLNFRRALQADARATFGYLSRRPGINSLTGWLAKEWQSFNAATADNPASGSMVPPVPGELHARFGWNAVAPGKELVFHAGVDLEAPAGAPVRASREGIVRELRRDASGLWRITLEHGGGWRSVYGNLGLSSVRTGERVATGQELGRAGSNSPEGQVVHWEVWRGLQPLDPGKYLKP